MMACVREVQQLIDSQCDRAKRDPDALRALVGIVCLSVFLSVYKC